VAGERREQLRQLAFMNLGLIGACRNEQQRNERTGGATLIAALAAALSHTMPATARGI
jgi:hypothetical protein